MKICKNVGEVYTNSCAEPRFEPKGVEIEQKGQTSKIKNNQGIDIVMAIDVSASMLAKDLKPNRLDALKNVADEFIKNRISDRIGLVEYLSLIHI